MIVIIVKLMHSALRRSLVGVDYMDILIKEEKQFYSEGFAARIVHEWKLKY